MPAQLAGGGYPQVPQTGSPLWFVGTNATGRAYLRLPGLRWGIRTGVRRFVGGLAVGEDDQQPCRVVDGRPHRAAASSKPTGSHRLGSHAVTGAAGLGLGGVRRVAPRIGAKRLNPVGVTHHLPRAGRAPARSVVAAGVVDLDERPSRRTPSTESGTREYTLSCSSSPKTSVRGGEDRARRPVGQHHDERRAPPPACARTSTPRGAHRTAVRRRDNAHLTGQQIAELLQSVAIPVGVGKTMIAEALGLARLSPGACGAVHEDSRMLADLAGGHADRTWAARLRR